MLERNWIGQSEGARGEWAVAKSDKVITTFTTRLDTVYGAAALLLAPEHPLVDTLIAGVPGGAAIARKVEALRRQTRRAQGAGGGEKERNFPGRFPGEPLSGGAA